MEGYDARSKLQTVLECDADCKGEEKVENQLLVEKPKNRLLLPLVCMIVAAIAIVVSWLLR